MKIAPHELEKNGFALVEELKHSELKQFVKDKKVKTSFFWYIFLATLALTWMISCSFFTFYLLKHKIELLKGLLYFFSGFGLVFLFIPFHEFIHAFGYKMVGAKKVSYYSNFKKMYFAAVADKFVTNYKEFTFLALLPYLFVLATCLSLIPFVNAYLQLLILGFLILHTLFCSGDFFLLNYMHSGKENNMLLYDDSEKATSYFYEKR